MNTPTIDKFLDLPTVADRLGISTRQIYRLIARGELRRPVKVGRASRLPESEVIEFTQRLLQNRQPAFKESP
jgi:excisionase family DNA binding protein